MAGSNPLREALESGRFCHVVELVASAAAPEARVLEAASQLAQVPGVVAGSITSFAGGAMGHDPIRVGTAVRARGLTPNVHLTCVNRERSSARSALLDLHALGIENVFALSGDYPKSAASGGPAPSFDLDSVQLVTLINEMRQAGMPFWISVAVSPFKYTEPDCAYQYLKLEKKIAAGADYAITQLGFDARKFRELKRYLDERNLRIPVLGNVYVLAAKPAERMAKGEPPGCWVAPELLAKIQAEAKAADTGQAARLERAARMVAIVRGLGYAGAYLGGDHRADHIRWVIRRSEALSAKWEEYAEQMSYAPKGGFYFYESPANARKKRGLLPRLLDLTVRIFPVNREGALRRALTAIFRRIDKSPAAARGLERAEFAVKSPMFGCQACGNCVLGMMEYVCPQSCPKGMRNGPCGGSLTLNGRCEVVEKPCIWVAVYERAKSADRVDDLRFYIPPPNRSLQGTSSCINFFLKRYTHPESVAPPARHQRADSRAPMAGDSGKTAENVVASQPNSSVVKIDAHQE
jgi:methylenetetrahydrofolate reductase (NADPH)